MAGRESTFEAFKRSSFIIKICLGLLILCFLFHPILSFIGPWRDNDEDLGGIDYDYHLVKAEREQERPGSDHEVTAWLDEWPDSDLKTATIAALVISLLAVVAMLAALVLFCLWMLPLAGIAMIFAALLILIAIICYVAIENLGSTNNRGMFADTGGFADQDTDLGWGAWMAIIAMIFLALAGGLLLAFTLWTRSWKKMNKIYGASFAPAVHSPVMGPLPTFPGGPGYGAPMMPAPGFAAPGSPVQYGMPGGMPMMVPNDNVMMAGVPPAF